GHPAHHLSLTWQETWALQEKSHGLSPGPRLWNDKTLAMLTPRVLVPPVGSGGMAERLAALNHQKQFSNAVSVAAMAAVLVHACCFRPHPSLWSTLYCTCVESLVLSESRCVLVARINLEATLHNLRRHWPQGEV
ncbi:unnamed protein product, partial [Pleuronectes platessa]